MLDDMQMIVVNILLQSRELAYRNPSRLRCIVAAAHLRQLVALQLEVIRLRDHAPALRAPWLVERMRPPQRFLDLSRCNGEAGFFL